MSRQDAQPSQSPAGTAAKAPIAPPRLRCLFNRHEPAGHRADWNGEAYISRCEHCDAPIIRLKKGRWRRDPRRTGEEP